MPTYDVKCPECGIETEVFCKIADRNEQPCPECGEKMEVTLNPNYALHKFKAGWYEHLDLQPVYCGSKQQLKDECKKRDLTSVYANEW